jgi:hypothetical protein
MTVAKEYHVFTKAGDGTSEVEGLARAFRSREEAGLHKYFYVSRANQTVVMVENSDAPLARELRRRPGWTEPHEPADA